MTTEEVIRTLTRIKNQINFEWTDAQKKMDALNVAIEALSAQPEIIRCEECENWQTTWQNGWSPNYHYCAVVDGVRRNDFYCGDAERRNDD